MAFGGCRALTSDLSASLSNSGGGFASDPSAAQKYLSSGEVRSLLDTLASALETVEPFGEATIEATLRATAERAGVKAAVLIHATRVAVTGRAVSAGLFQVLVLLGRECVVRRLRRILNYTPAA